jgi:AraC-like DNA-binding protein
MTPVQISSITEPMGALESPHLLARCPQVSDLDLGQARKHVARYFGDHVISKSHYDSDLRFAHRNARLCSLSFNTITYGADVEVHVDWVDRPLFLMMVPLEGRAEIVQGNQRSEINCGDVVIIDPRETFDLHLYAGQRNLTVGIPAETLKHALSARQQDDRRMSFSHGALAIEGALSVLMRFTGFLCAELDLMQAGSVPPEVPQTLESSFMHLFLQAALEPQRQIQTVIPRSVRLAQRYMQAHCKETLTVEAVAAAAGVSPRTLRAHFSEACETSPGRWLRDYRLQCARKDLQDGRANVTEVALRYAFSNVGRFARAYREVFGETPSETQVRRA